MLSINANLIWLIAVTFAALSVGTTVRLVALRGSADDVIKQRMGSLKVWWMLAVLWSLAAVFGKIGAAVLLALASGLAFREYLKLIGPVKAIGPMAIGCVFACGIVHYGLIVTGPATGGMSDIAKWFFPITLMLLLSVIRSTTAAPEQYMRITAGLFWGAMLMIYGLSHSLFLFDVSAIHEPLVGSAGWFLFLLLLTEMNDIMQAIVGRKFGRHKITPRVSPNKSLEGLLGGLVATVVLSTILAPFLTTLLADRSKTMGVGLAVVAGLLISLFGFLGDINMSAIKRDAGVKDGSAMLPGMGGVIDRIDSLTFTAPAFFYFLEFVNLFSPHTTGT